MIIALAPPSVIALQSVGGSPSVTFAPPPKSAVTGAGSLVTTRAVVSSTTTTVTTSPAPISVAAAVPSAAQAATPDASLTVAPTTALPSPGGVSPMALLRTTLAATTPLVTASTPAIEPAAGLWVLATARCPLPAGTDLNAWAECTQPLGFNGGELAVLEKPKAGNKAQTTGGLFSIARTRYRTAPLPAVPGTTLPGLPGPAVVQVEVPGLTGRSYVYIALRPEITDAEGRFVSARAWPVACPPPGSPDVTRRGDRCVASSLKAVADAASAMPTDGGYVLRWVDPTDAGSAGDTGGSRTYAPPPPVVYKAPRKLTPLEAAEPLPITDLPPELAAQQPQVPAYAPRDEGDDSAPTKAASSKAGGAKTTAKPAAKVKKKS